ncbi:uncharacterized protein LOC120169891 [Hibiscus syriacus]|uniref:uncharacterized protein LOC120169891 n=1 Tax=Hibiscus syriacus TaxID=106335 RepID=UPI001923EDDF|nr:uncharacterized protein LOC120169891 [Hibiscus syriacus]
MQLQSDNGLEYRIISKVEIFATPVMHWRWPKMDLEKTFNRIRWDFISNALVDADFPPGIRRTIMNFITSSSFQVQWNKSLSQSFVPEMGIRQGDLLSPYLFVLAMEHLGHLINHFVAHGFWLGWQWVESGRMFACSNFDPT